MEALRLNPQLVSLLQVSYGNKSKLNLKFTNSLNYG